MKNKKIIIILAVVLAALVAVFAGVYFATRPETVEGDKTINVTVVFADKSEKNYEISTDAEYLADALVEEKIIEEERRLQEIKNIQKAYQTEMTNMKNKLEEMHKSIRESMEAYNPAEEFGIDDESYGGMIEDVDAFCDKMLEAEDFSKYEFLDYSEENQKKGEQDFWECLNNPNYEIIFERHGWKNVKDFYEELPKLVDDTEYFFLFKLEAEKVNSTKFGNTLLGIMCRNNPNGKMSLKCNVIFSDDADNHFWLLKSGK